MRFLRVTWSYKAPHWWPLSQKKLLLLPGFKICLILWWLVLSLSETWSFGSAIILFSLHFLYKPLPFHSDWTGKYRHRRVHGAGEHVAQLRGPAGPGRGCGHPGGETEDLPQDLHGQKPVGPQNGPAGGEPVAPPAAAHLCQAYTTFRKHILALSFSLSAPALSNPPAQNTRGPSASSHTVNLCCICVCFAVLHSFQDKIETKHFPPFSLFTEQSKIFFIQPAAKYIFLWRVKVVKFSMSDSPTESTQ